MSVMLGMVVWTFGLLSTHFSAASTAPGALGVAGWAAAPRPPPRAPPAMTFMPTMPTPALRAALIASVRSGAMLKLYATRITSCIPFWTSAGISVA